MNEHPATLLRCVVERITYQNPENGYSVLKVKVKGYNDLVTLVGNLLEVPVGSVLLAIDEVTYAMSGVGLNGADYLIEIIADNDEDLWRVVDESIRPLPGVEQTWWASTVSVEKESYWLEPPHEGVLLGD